MPLLHIQAYPPAGSVRAAPSHAGAPVVRRPALPALPRQRAARRIAVSATTPDGGGDKKEAGAETEAAAKAKAAMLKSEMRGR